MIGYLSEEEEIAIKELKQKLTQTLGENIYEIILYGSKARGDFHKGSDIDLLIVVKNSSLKVKDVIMEIANDIEIEYGFLISVHIRSTEQYNKQIENKVNFFMQNVKKEGIAV